jgi:hypothetical protein
MHTIGSEGAAELSGTDATFSRPRRLANARVVAGNVPSASFRPLFAPGAELLDTGQHDLIAVIPPRNVTAQISKAAEEARILSHPDVVAAIAEALPDLESWEKTL